MADIATRQAQTATARTAAAIAGMLVLAALVLRVLDPGRVDWVRTFFVIFGSLLIQALPFVMLGALAAALVEVFVPIGTLEKLGRLPRPLQLPAAALAGLAFPICECGSVPVARRLMQRGLLPSAAVTFMLAAPVINPVVIASTFVAFRGRTSMWTVVGGRFVLGMLVAIAVGWVLGTRTTEELLKQNPEEAHEHLLELGRPEARWRRFFVHLGNDFLFMGRYLLLGASIAAAIQTFLPASVLTSVADLPVLSVLWSSFLPFYMAPSQEPLASLTLDNYRRLAHLPLIHRAFWNSFFLGISSSTLVMLLTAFMAWIVVRTQWPGKGLLDFLAFSPIAVPGLVLGIAILWLYLTLPVPIYGTIWILLIAYVIKYLPYGMRACSSSMHQIQKELEEASEMSGASWAYTFVRVILPLLVPGFVAGWIYVITHSFRELSTSIMLYRSGTEVLSVVIFELWDAGQYPELSALGMTLVVILVAISLLARWIGTKFAVQQL